MIQVGRESSMTGVGSYVGGLEDEQIFLSSLRLVYPSCGVSPARFGPNSAGLPPALNIVTDEGADVAGSAPAVLSAVVPGAGVIESALKRKMPRIEPFKLVRMLGFSNQAFVLFNGQAPASIQVL